MVPAVVIHRMISLGPVICRGIRRAIRARPHMPALAPAKNNFSTFDKLTEQRKWFGRVRHSMI